MAVIVRLDEKHEELQLIIIENELLKVIIIPELGAKIWQITYKPQAKDMLWNNPRLKPGIVPFQSSFEEAFFGGWDELFPNDYAENIKGKPEPDHGEIWALPWEFRVETISENEAVIHMWVETVICHCRMEKWITLKSDASKLFFHYAITNLSMEEQPFLWKLHPALIMDKDCRMDQGDNRMVLLDIGNPRQNAQSGEYNWPYMKDLTETVQDMRLMLNPATKVKEIQFAKEMTSGWCALTNTREQIGFGLSFDRKVFPNLFLFSSFGGWEGEQMIIMEPCTGYGMYVNEGIERGTHQILQAGQRMETDLIAVIYTGLTSVSFIDSTGEVFL